MAGGHGHDAAQYSNDHARVEGEASTKSGNGFRSKRIKTSQLNPPNIGWIRMSLCGRVHVV